MKVSELRKAERAYEALRERIKRETVETLASETKEEQQRRIEELLLPRNYYIFWNYYLGASAGGGLGDKSCATFHQKSYEELVRHSSILQFRLWFRGAAKSLQTVVGNALALKQTGGLKFMLVVGINELRAKMLLSDLQAQLEANQRLIRDFGPQIRSGDWRDGSFETLDGCYFMALGIDQPFRGLRRYANRIDFAVVDDVEDRDAAANKLRIAKRADKITRDLRGAMSAERSRMVICNNLAIRDGLIGELQERTKQLENVYTSKIPIIKSVLPTWPEMWPLEKIEQLKKEVDHFTWLSEYMNKPVERGRVIKPEWIKWAQPTNAKPEGAIVFWDLSYTAAGDYKACAVVGSQAGKYVVLDAFCRQCDLEDVMSWHYERIAKWRAKEWPLLCFYDATASQEPVFSPMWAEASGRYGADPPQPHHISAPKHVRIEGTLVSYMHQGTLVFSKKIKDTPDMTQGQAQLLAFEKGSTAPDDFPDALEAAVRLCAKYFPATKGNPFAQIVIGKRADRSF